MSYGLKYELIGRSVPFGKNWKVRISGKNYIGTAINRNVPANPFTLKKDSAGTIRGTSLDFAIRAIADFEFIEFYTENSSDWLIELVDTGALVWQGFIIPEQYQEPYAPAPVTVSFTATDQLGLLKNYTYTAASATRISYLSMLKACLANTGLALGYAIAIAIKESRQNQSRSVLSEIYVNPQIYNGRTCYDVIVDILSHFDAEITQHNGRWLIRRSVDKLATRYLYDAAGTYTGTQPAPSVQGLGEYGAADVYPTGSPLALSLAKTERKILISEDYQTKSTLLPLLETGAWTDDYTPPPGWTCDLLQNPVAAKVWAEVPYVLVKPRNGAFASYGNLLTGVNEVKKTTDSIEFSFDYAYITPEGFPITNENCTIWVDVKLFDPANNRTWFLSNTMGWVETSMSHLEIANVYSSGCVKQAPNWFNYKVFTTGFPADGTLMVYLNVPHLTANHGTLFNSYDKYGAAFKNVIFNILHDEKPLPTGLDYEITLNASTKAESKEIMITGGDVPDLDNALLQFAAYTSLSDYHTKTGLWTMPGITGTGLLVELVAKLYASQNRQARQFLTGSIRGANMAFDSVLQHNYPYTRRFEIVEASYNLCADRADVTLAELLDYTDTAFVATSANAAAAAKPTSANTANNIFQSFDALDAVTWDALKLYLSTLNLTTTTTVNSDSKTELISGAVVWQSGLTFRSTDIVYKILGINYTAPAAEFTLATADATLSRIDAFYVNNFGALQVATGTPATNPATPVLTASQLGVTTVLIPPASTTPSGITTTKIYDENTEWTTTETHDTYVTNNFANTTVPKSGSKRISTVVAVPDSVVAVPLHRIGEAYQGGIIFWLAPDGHSGLIAAISDTANDQFYESLSGGGTYTTGATGTAVGTGQANTTLMLANDHAVNLAAGYCDTLIIDAYTDWYLPSVDELAAMFFRRVVIGNFGTKTYWSSTETAWDTARCIAFGTGTSYVRQKNNPYNVRAIRSFTDATIVANQPVLNYTMSATQLKFVTGTSVAVTAGIVSMWIRSTVAWLQGSLLVVDAISAGASVGRVVLSAASGLCGYNYNDDAWQYVAIPLSKFNTSAATITGFTITPTGSWPNGLDLGFDDIRYQNTDVVIPPVEIAIQDISFEFRDVTAGTAQTWDLDIKANYGYTIEAVVLETDAGTLTGVSIKIGSTAVTSLSALTVDSTVDETASTGAKTVAAGNRITINTTTGCTGTPKVLRGKIKIKRT